MASKYVAKDVKGAGKGLFAACEIEAGSIVLQEERPLLAVLDSQHLKEACAWCFKYTGETDEQINLSVCTGCRILRYCDVNCQSASWKHSHKLECKIYKDLYPGVLPNTARLVMQILLRRKKSTFATDDWNDLFNLQHHIQDFKQLGGSDNETYGNIQLMARAAQEYGKTGDDLGLVEQLGGRVLINSLTLTTPLYTPLGIALSVRASLLNHSCNPNTVISFSGSQLTARAMRPISANEELTISYIDITFPPEARRSELASRYFFRCICPECSSTRTLGRPEPPPEVTDIPKEKRDKLEENVIEHITMAAQAKGPQPKGLTHLARALALFDEYPPFPAWRQPLARARTDIILSLLGHKHYLAALLQSLKQRYFADPVTVPGNAHPVRVARTWVLSKLVMQMESLSMGTAGAWVDDDGNYQLGDGGQDVRDLQIKFNIDWQLLTWTLVAEVAGQVEKSHGKDSRLHVEVLRAVEDLNTGFRSAGKWQPSAGVAEECQKKMQRLATEGWDWWKEWERSARKKKPFIAMYKGDPTEQDAIGVLIGDVE